MNRRGFLAGLAGLPFVGKLFAKAEPLSYPEKGYPMPNRRSKPLPEVKWRSLGEPVLGHTSRLRTTMDGPAGRQKWEYYCSFCGVAYQRATVYPGTIYYPGQEIEKSWVRTPCPARNTQPCTTCGSLRKEMDKAVKAFDVREYGYQCGQCGAKYFIVSASQYGRSPTQDILEDCNQLSGEGREDARWHSQQQAPH